MVGSNIFDQFDVMPGGEAVLAGVSPTPSFLLGRPGFASVGPNFGLTAGAQASTARPGGMFGRLGDDLAPPRAIMMIPSTFVAGERGDRPLHPEVQRAFRRRDPWATAENGTYGKGIAVFGDEPTPFQGLPPEIEDAYVALARDRKSTAADLLAFGKQHGFEVGQANADRFVRDRFKPGVRIADKPGYIPVPRPLTDPGDGATGAFLRGVVNPVNLLDEMGGVVDTLGGTRGRENVWNSDRRFGDILWQNIDKNRSILGFDETRHPLASYGGQLASGFVAPALSVEGAGMAAARAALRQGAARAAARQAARRAVATRLALSGGMEGAVAGSGAGEGDLADRLPSAAVGGALGAIASPAIGLAVPFAARGAAAARNYAADRLPAVRDAARRLYGRRATEQVRPGTYDDPLGETNFEPNPGQQDEPPTIIRAAGQRRLSEALEKQDFAAIDFGQLSTEKLDRINAIRGRLGEDVLQDSRLVIPANVVRKLYEQRVLRDGMSPGQVADVLNSVFHADKSRAVASRYPHIQALINARDILSNIGFIGRDPSTGETVIKSAYPTKTKDLPKRVR